MLAYLRLPAPQMVIFRLMQYEISRDLRRLLPLIRDVLPCPEVWNIIEEKHPPENPKPLPSDSLKDGRVVLDATEQRVSRSSSKETHKRYYSGKKKAFTLKTQVVTDGDHHIVAISPPVPGHPAR